jgi:hypothetical protein
MGLHDPPRPADRTQRRSAGVGQNHRSPTDGGPDRRYRKTGDHSQLRGSDMGEPFARIWFYDWLPDSDASP